jgi:2'-5' RNA ligase
MVNNQKIDFKEWLIIEDTHKFSCVLALFPASDAKRVLDWGKKHVSNQDVYKEKGREDDPHVTILYGLHTHDAKDVIDLIKSQKGHLELVLKNVSKFNTHPDYDVLKIDVESLSFKALNKKLKTLPYTSSFSGYKPHCTISYIKKGTCENLVGNKDFAGNKIKFTEVQFANPDEKKTKITIS